MCCTWCSAWTLFLQQWCTLLSTALLGWWWVGTQLPPLYKRNNVCILLFVNYVLTITHDVNTSYHNLLQNKQHSICYGHIQTTCHMARKSALSHQHLLSALCWNESSFYLTTTVSHFPLLLCCTCVQSAEGATLIWWAKRELQPTGVR